MSSRAVVYTGGDVEHSGDLAKMFDSQTSTPVKPSRPNSGPVRSASNSGSMCKKLTGSGSVSSSRPNSGSIAKKPSGSVIGSGSGPTALQPTGLITSGPLSGDQRVASKKSVLGAGGGATHLVGEVRFKYKVSKLMIWSLVLVLIVAVLGGCFVMVVMKKDVVLVVAVGLFVFVVVVVLWNWALGRKGVLRFIDGFPDAELRSAADGQFVKVTGVMCFCKI